MKVRLILALFVCLCALLLGCKKPDDPKVQTLENITAPPSIRQMTDVATVSRYLKENHRLPSYYLTKNEARKLGWNPAVGNLCDVLPGRAIGGDAFRNRERKLPVRGKYYEADVNYNCGTRGPDRVIFDQTGNVWLTRDHYKTFEKL